MSSCTTVKKYRGQWYKKKKRAFASREEAEPYRLSLEKAVTLPVETYRCPRCYELHIGRVGIRRSNNYGSGGWDRLAGQLIMALRKLLDRPVQ